MEPQERVQAADVPLLRGLPPEQLDYLLQGATLQRVPKGTTLFEEGGEPECLHLLLSGSVEAFTHEEGRDHTVWIMSQHDVFMPSAAIIDEPYLLSARTLKPSRLLLLRVDRVREEMARCPHFACRLAKLLAGRLRVTIRHLKDLKTRTGAQRLAAYLIRLIDARHRRQRRTAGLQRHPRLAARHEPGNHVARPPDGRRGRLGSARAPRVPAGPCSRRALLPTQSADRRQRELVGRQGVVSRCHLTFRKLGNGAARPALTSGMRPQRRRQPMFGACHAAPPGAPGDRARGTFRAWNAARRTEF